MTKGFGWRRHTVWKTEDTTQAFIYFTGRGINKHIKNRYFWNDDNFKEFIKQVQLHLIEMISLKDQAPNYNCAVRALNNIHKSDYMEATGNSDLMIKQPMIKQEDSSEDSPTYSYTPPTLTPMKHVSLPKGTGQGKDGKHTYVDRRRMAQRTYSSRRDSPVMVRLLQDIVAAQDK